MRLARAIWRLLEVAVVTGGDYTIPPKVGIAGAADVSEVLLLAELGQDGQPKNPPWLADVFVGVASQTCLHDS